MDDDPPVCSAKACRQAARHVLVWNNPRLHTPDREKTWVACDAHRASLAEHLDVRGFLRRIDPLAPPAAADPSVGGAPDDTAAGDASCGSRWTCPVCSASFPVEQTGCPVCAGVRTGSCGSRD